MKYLAIDYGQKRTGIAVSDSGGSMAFPRRTIQMRTREAFFEELLALLEAEAPDALVIGLPVNLDGEETLTTRQTRNFAKNLEKKDAIAHLLDGGGAEQLRGGNRPPAGRAIRRQKPGRPRSASRRPHPAILS